ncbi:MAG TPA: type I-E CRISPR-associated protein Cse2/CasB [Anaerolineae bacterium]|nr:type I-E CRISPR-associated protein Cse2/CasB [Anaerolineae bacterium]
MTDFIDYLEGLKEDRPALAALRRGLGYTADDAPAETRHIIEPRLSQTTSQSWERACYIVGPLFAFHPESIDSGDMGWHLRAIRGDDPNETAVERRFTQLLAAHPDDLADYLRQAVSLLKAKDQPIHWRRLFFDVLTWQGSDEDARNRVQKRWAASFWRASFDKPTGAQTPTTTEEGE